MVALRSCGDAMCQIISTHLVNHLCNSSRWLIYGRPTFAVDRTKFAVPRTNKNLSAFAAAADKTESDYKSKADYSKAKTTQIAVSLGMHLSTGFPAFWNFGGSSACERGLLSEMLKRLPEKSRLVMDAYYFGFQFWNRLIDSGLRLSFGLARTLNCSMALR